MKIMNLVLASLLVVAFTSTSMAGDKTTDELTKEAKQLEARLKAINAKLATKTPAKGNGPKIYLGLVKKQFEILKTTGSLEKGKICWLLKAKAGIIGKPGWVLFFDEDDVRLSRGYSLSYSSGYNSIYQGDKIRLTLTLAKKDIPKGTVKIIIGDYETQPEDVTD